MSKPTLNCGRALVSIIKTAIPELNAIAPIIATAEQAPAFPFATYRRISTSYANDSKDHILEEESATYSLAIASDVYDKGLLVAQKTINALYRYRGDVAGIKVINIDIDSTEEGEEDGIFVQNLTINLTYKQQ